VRLVSKNIKKMSHESVDPSYPLDRPSKPRLSVPELMYRRSTDYAKRVCVAHLKAQHQPVTEISAEQVDAVHTRLLHKYPYRLLL